MNQPHAAGGRSLRFTKMHGAGNDFVVVDLRHGQAAPDAALCRALADRHTGVGCDQILTIEAPRSANACASYRIWNADGSQAQQCGNGARCVAAWLVRDGAAQGPRFELDSPAGTHVVATVRNALPDSTVTVHGLHTRPATAWGTTRLAPGESMTINEAVTDVPKSARFAEIGWKPD